MGAHAEESSDTSAHAGPTGVHPLAAPNLLPRVPSAARWTAWLSLASAILSTEPAGWVGAHSARP
eukprot:13532186-Alexandrium_andersonii.AAC.1